MSDVNLQDLKTQAMMQEFQQQRMLTGNQFGDRCVELAGMLAVAKRQADDAQAKVVEMTEQIAAKDKGMEELKALVAKAERKLKVRKKPQPDEAPK